MKTRVACINVIDFPLCVLLKDLAPRSLYPYAVAENEHPHALLVAVNQIAERDVHVGMTVAQARNRCAQLRILVQDTKQEKYESDKLQELLYCVGPHVETGAPGEYYLELRGLTRLHGGEDGIGKRIRSLFPPTTYAVKVGIAGNKPVARIASLIAHNNETLIIPHGSERDFLSPLPIAALGLTHDTYLMLNSLGLKTIGEITRLPIQEITRRFGEDAHCLVECLQCENTSPVSPFAFSNERFAELRFDDPLDSLSQLEDNIVRLLQSMLEKLQSSGEGCREISILLEGAYFKPKQINVRLNQLTCSLSAWRRQVHHSLSGIQFVFGVTTIRVTLTAVAPLRPSQMSLFSSAVADDVSTHQCKTELDRLPLSRIAILNKVLPEESVRLNLQNDNVARDVNQSCITPQCYYSGSSLAGLRLYKNPQTIKVTTDKSNLYGIVSAAGVERVVWQCAPYHLSGGWWEREFQRSYYEVETDRGMSYLLFRDEIQSKWFLQGYFD